MEALLSRCFKGSKEALNPSLGCSCEGCDWIYIWAQYRDP